MVAPTRSSSVLTSLGILQVDSFIVGINFRAASCKEAPSSLDFSAVVLTYSTAYTERSSPWESYRPIRGRGLCSFFFGVFISSLWWGICDCFLFVAWFIAILCLAILVFLCSIHGERLRHIFCDGTCPRIPTRPILPTS